MATTSAGDTTGKTYHDELAIVREELDKCMKCGNCMAVCPVYGAEKVETSVTRSKIAVAQAVLDGKLELDDPQVYQMMFNCLVCKSCMTACPTKVNFDRIMLAFRAALVRKNGLPWLKKMIFSTLKHPKLFDAGMRIGAAMQPLAFKGEDGGASITPRSPFAKFGAGIGMDGERKMPSLNVKTLRERVPEVVRAAAPKMKVAFFTGDSLNYIYPDAGMDVIEVLTANSIDVHIPKEQNCCGVPVLVHGDVETVRALAKKNIDAFEKTGCDYLITACGSCGGAWQHDYTEILANDPVYATKAAHWATRTYDISTFLTKVITLREPKGKLDKVVTYHDSCHLKKSMKVSAEPREIIKSIPGITLKEMKAPDTCCGSGGSYVLSHYDTSSAIGRKKAEDVTATGADTVSVGCPACMMQLFDNANRYGKNEDVVHFVSLLAESYRREKSA
ncbi:(Fe-S)-binding protein [Desulfogranum japonicum]|uniref:(Fe-S)-binding protein n=1 Tax=Desulfogranum japonicum TaxID=231447 RepID=UPI0004141400|nr:(Fe-S)-binding protein [Desulfogranum japonicum]